MANTEVLKEPRGFIRLIEIVSKHFDIFLPSLISQLLSIQKYVCCICYSKLSCCTICYNLLNFSATYDV